MFRYISVIGSVVAFSLLAIIAKADVFTVTTTTNNISGSIQDAIFKANTTLGRDTIRFNLTPTNKVHVFVLDTAMICLRDNAGVLIDGYSQPGASPNTNPPGQPVNAQPKIMLYNNANYYPGLCIRSDSNVIRGLILYNFGDPATQTSVQSGITIGDGTNSYMDNQVAGCFIGVDSTGTTGNSKQDVGVYVQLNATDNMIGGEKLADRNVIASNSLAGVRVNSSFNTLLGNFVGVGKNGLQGAGRQDLGIGLYGGTDNYVGGVDSIRNLVAGNRFRGIFVDGNSNNVGGNYVGVNLDATATVDSQDIGIHVRKGGSQIGAPLYPNVIGGNNYGILLRESMIGTQNNIIASNYIGTDTSGQTDLGNNVAGIYVYDQNNSYGVQDNHIGGGIPFAGPNVIAYNDSGIVIRGTNSTSYPSVKRISIRKNSIYNNGLGGIVLVDSGNTQKPAPNITLVKNYGNQYADVEGNAQPYDSIDIFMTPLNEGKYYLTTVEADINGFWQASGIPVQEGMNITATATDTSGNTSEFSFEYGLPKYSLDGQVFTPTGDSMDQGVVYAYMVDSTRTKMRLMDIDSVKSFDMGYYYLQVPLGRYLILANPNDQTHPNAMSTFYKKSLKWMDAKSLVLTGDSFNVDFTLKKAPSQTTGNGFITGQIVEGQNYPNKRGRTEGDPLSNINCSIADQQSDSIFQQTATDSVGIFTFTDLPEGHYYIHADVPGIPVDTTGLNNFNVPSGGASYDSVLVVVDSEQVSVTKKQKATGIAESGENDFSVQGLYPNPADYRTNLVVRNNTEQSESLVIEIYDVTGQEKLYRTLVDVPLGTSKTPINLQEFPAEPLMINIKHEDGRSVYQGILIHLK